MICPPGGDGLSSSGGRVFAFLGDQDSERVPKLCQPHRLVWLLSACSRESVENYSLVFKGLQRA